MARRDQGFQTIRSEGGLLPPDLLRRVITPAAALPGTRPEDYGLPPGERLNEVITQSWNRLRKHWADFRAGAVSLPEGEAGTGLTNDKWSLPLLRELGFGLLPTSAGPEIGGRSFAISRFFGPVAVHLVGCGLSLDRRAAGQRGAAVANPHGLVQEFLNRSAEHTWAIVSNGMRLRILRDNQALSRQAFLEFDLESMFSGEAYADFVVLWLMAHATRFAPREADRPESCWLELWTREAEEQGTRALGDLRGGVERALQIFGQGFTSHPGNTDLRDSLRTGRIPLADFHGQLLRVVYRLIFLFVSEDRTLDGQPLLHPRDDSASGRIARERYSTHYSVDRLRELAGKIKGTRHGDLWRQFQLLVSALSGQAAFAPQRRQLALPALGSFLWTPSSTGALNGAELTNYDFLDALRHLAFTRQGKALRPVDYRNLGAEELGGVYESLLALTPQLGADGAHFTFAEFAGNERKTSGSYYTPDSLVQCLLDSALDPVVQEALKGKSGAEAEKALLTLKICDPAAGSGHFLVGAAHRLARHLARARSLAEGDSEPSALLYQHALRDVIGRCLYGVDVNPMAAELCRVSLWLEALEPGKPLSFLDHHIRVGNSLLGTVPELIAGGLPDEAFTALEGDDNKACAILKKRNKAERKGLGPLFAKQDVATQTRLQQAAATLEELPDDHPEHIRAKELAFRRHEETEEYRERKMMADAWCAAFFIRKVFAEPGRESSAIGITQERLNDLASGRPLPPALAREVEYLALDYQFLHWHLAFPEVFAKGGFDCVLGNPPWEHTELKEKEWFADRVPTIASTVNGAERKRLILALRGSAPKLYAEFSSALRHHDAVSHFLGHSDRFPLCGRGRINLYAVFAEAMRDLVRPTGALGAVLPSGLATDHTTKQFFVELTRSKTLWSFFEFENEGFFPGAGHGHMLRFALTTIRGLARRTAATDFVFQAKALPDLDDLDKHFSLSAADIALLNPNTGTCPIFAWKRDAELTKAIYRRVPVLLQELDGNRQPVNAWEITFRQGLFNMTSDSHLFRTREQLQSEGWALQGSTFRRDSAEYLPLYEAKMVQHYNHRYGSFADSPDGQRAHVLPTVPVARLMDCTYVAQPYYWVHKPEVDSRLATLTDGQWLLGWRDVTDSRASARTIVACVIPRTAVSGKLPLILTPRRNLASLYSTLCSFPLDYVARQKIGGLSLSMFIMKQLPVHPPGVYAGLQHWCKGTLEDWFVPRVLELSYTSWDLAPFAADLDWFGPPFQWDEARRFVLRCELDAALFHVYLPADERGHWRSTERENDEDLARLRLIFPTPRDAVAYIMDTFPIVRRRDEEAYRGDYRTKRVILEIYDAILQSIRTGEPYHTRLQPSPADPRCCHPPRKAGG